MSLGKRSLEMLRISMVDAASDAAVEKTVFALGVF